MNFSLIGAGGYVAPRHMKAIRDLGHQLISVYDVHDGLAVLDNYFPGAACFSDIQSYSAFHTEHPLDFVSICSPNHLHFDHVAWALSQGANVICEKPLVMDPAQLDELHSLEGKSGKKIYTILQLRQVAAVLALKEKIGLTQSIYDVDVKYVSARGNWYFNSWKGNEMLSGGLVTNIGIHLFDLLLWIFGPLQKVELDTYSQHQASGSLILERARVHWFLSVDANDLPDNNQRSYRQMSVDGQVIRLDAGMESLHNQCYTDILQGKGPGIKEARPSIELCNQIRQMA